MSQPPVSPIPPFGPPEEPEGSTTEQRLARMERMLAEQRETIAFLRQRSGWIMLWAVLATLGSCGPDVDASDLQPVQSEIQNVQRSVDEIKNDVSELRQERGSDTAPQPQAPKGDAAPDPADAPTG